MARPVLKHPASHPGLLITQCITENWHPSGVRPGQVPETTPNVKAKGVESLSTARANAQLDLAEAMEDHDEPRLRRALAVAEHLEVAPEEIAAARRMLEFEINKLLLVDAKQMRASIRQLALRVAEAERQQKPPEAQAPPRFAQMAELLEKRVWSSLEPKISKIVSSVVSKATARTGKADGRVRNPPSVTFEDLDTDKDGFISREEFEAAQKKGLLGGPLHPVPVQPPAAASAQGQVGPSLQEAPAEHRSVVRSTLFAAMHGAAQRLLEKKDFKELDTDGDGLVSQKELDSSLVDMKVEGQEMEQARQQILQQADTDGDGVLSQEEFERAKAEVSKKQTSEYSEKKLLVRSILSGSYSDASKKLLRTKTFQEMDKDGDGRICEEEVGAALASMAVSGEEAVQARAELMQQVDKDGDGKISQEELQQAKAEAAEAPTSPTTTPEPRSLTRSLLALTYSDIAKRLLEQKSFKDLDKDGDGCVTKEELAANLADMSVSGEEAAKANKEIMQMVDKDGCKGSAGIRCSVQVSL
ncbi:CPK13 [Symbiodinium sp. CCMP2456]|nr:CPK13 [Symbiodinium sp. CCMP2456]